MPTGGVPVYQDESEKRYVLGRGGSPVDATTIAAYDGHSAEYSQQYRAVAPEGMQRAMLAFFHPGAPTADIGCGSGRDVAWLLEQKYPSVGYDASEEMLRQARAHYPGIVLGRSALPDLVEIPSNEYDNVLCAATLMHVGREHLITAVLSLARILRDEGRLVLSYRSSRSSREREADGRLFTEIPPGRLTLLLEAAGLRVTETQTQPDAVRPEIRWNVVLAEKGQLQVSRGLERVQSVLVQDRKFATYKFALVRALCSISRMEPHVVRWDQGRVLVPMRSIALRWLTYYWPLLTSDRYIAQRRGEGPEGPKQLAFRPAVARLAARYAAGGRFAMLQELEQHPDQFLDTLGMFRDTIRDGPVRHAGSEANPIFRYVRHCSRALTPDPFDDRLGWVEVPELVWLDISRFNHWIEDSLILRWAQLTAEMNGDPRAVGEYLPLLLDEPVDQRTTVEVRDLLLAMDHPITCVWSGKLLSERFHVDHVIPYSAWGNNDWWNMMPSLPTLNMKKSDALPTQALLLDRRECIVGYWREYFRRMPDRFGRQVSRGLGISVGHTGWERVAFAGLQEAVERVAMTRGLSRWSP